VNWTNIREQSQICLQHFSIHTSFSVLYKIRSSTKHGENFPGINSAKALRISALQCCAADSNVMPKQLQTSELCYPEWKK